MGLIRNSETGRRRDVNRLLKPQELSRADSIPMLQAPQDCRQFSHMYTRLAVHCPRAVHEGQLGWKSLQDRVFHVVDPEDPLQTLQAGWQYCAMYAR